MGEAVAAARQPARHDPGRAGYMINFTAPVPVRVAPLRRPTVWDGVNTVAG